jgi:ribosomal protein S18 acetylase RimI-like enzyme
MMEDYPEEDALYSCCKCGKLLRGQDTRIRMVCTRCSKKLRSKFTLLKVSDPKQRRMIGRLVTTYWGEDKQLMFDSEFEVAKLPAFYAKVDEEFAGFASFADFKDSVIIAALAVLPQYQNLGIGSGLIEKIKTEASKRGKHMLLVATSNDDLSALAFYQSLGFQIFEVKPDVIVQKHGEVLIGICGLPIRDELRMRLTLKPAL